MKCARLFYCLLSCLLPEGLNRRNLFVLRESMAVFNHLCETFPDENCVLTSREILAEVTTCSLGLTRHTARAQ